MTQSTQPPSPAKDAVRTPPEKSPPSIGVKVLIIVALVALLGIALFFVNLLAWERAGRAEHVAQDIGEAYGGAQTLRGPFLALPIEVRQIVKVQRGDEQVEEVELRRETLIISAESFLAEGDLHTQTLRRAIYDVPIYEAAMRLSGRFVIPDLRHDIPVGGTALWDQAYMLVGVSDYRAIDEGLVIHIEGQDAPLEFEPNRAFDRARTETGQSWKAVTAPVPNLEDGASFTFEGTLTLSGASSLSVIASGKDSDIRLAGDWPHPSFTGTYLPDERETAGEDFSARWHVPYLARGVAGVWLNGRGFSVAQADQSIMTLNLKTPTDGYVRVGRALKYALFFVAFTLLAVFLIELNSKIVIHGVQYILMGGAQVVFYLLLLSFSEHLVIELAYSVAAGATVVLSALYAISMFKSVARALIVLVVLTLVYALQYALILLEDYALLIGALLTFITLAMTMFVTRKVNWHTLGRDVSA